MAGIKDMIYINIFNSTHYRRKSIENIFKKISIQMKLYINIYVYNIKYCIILHRVILEQMT